MSLKKLKIATLVKNVTTATTAVPLSATSLLAFDVLIVAKAANTGNIYVGGSDVDNTDTPLAAGDPLSLTPPVSRDATENMYDLSKIYIDADTNGEGVHVTYAILDERIA